MTIGKNTKIRFVINMNLVLESLKSPPEASDLKLKKSKSFDLTITGSNGLLFAEDHLKPVSFAI